MDTALVLHRLQFAFTITFHYIFPQLTMGLALLILVLKTIAWRRRDSDYERAAGFWIRIFGINFAVGVVTGIPMEFQFGTNWASFAKAAGGVIGQTLAMEGMFSFFLESTFLGLLVYGAKRLSPGLHWFSALMVFVGSWLSGFFSSPPMHGCSIRWAMEWRRTGRSFFRALPRCSATRGSIGNMRII